MKKEKIITLLKKIWRKNAFFMLLLLFLVFTSFFSSFFIVDANYNASHFSIKSEQELKDFLYRETHSYSSSLIDVQLEIGYQKQNIGSLEEVVTMIKKLKDYTFYNVRENFEVFLDQKKVMDDYLIVLHDLLNNAIMLRDRLTLQLQNYKKMEIDCREQKQYYDREYYSAMNSFNDVLMQKSIDNAIVNEWCATDSRVKYNAYKLLHDQLDNYITLLNKRYVYRNSKKNTKNVTVMFWE